MSVAPSPVARLLSHISTIHRGRERPGAITTPRAPPCMAFWNKILGNEDVQRVDYYKEGLELLAANKFHEALTSFRLALKESPGDTIVLQQIAICYTRIGMLDEAAKTYRHVLQKDPTSPGAHYGLAFVLLRRGDEPGECIPHLEAFLSNAPDDEEAGAHVEHARWTLADLRERGHARRDDASAPDAGR